MSDLFVSHLFVRKEGDFTKIEDFLRQEWEQKHQEYLKESGILEKKYSYFTMYLPMLPWHDVSWVTTMANGWYIHFFPELPELQKLEAQYRFGHYFSWQGFLRRIKKKFKKIVLRSK